MTKKMYETLLFDLDNTLLDFTASEQHGLNQLYELHFSADIPKVAFLKTYEKINQKLWRQLHFGQYKAADIKTERFKQLAHNFKLTKCEKRLAQDYEALLVEETTWLPGAKEAIDKLRTQYRIGIITNGISNVQKQKCQLTGISEWCSSILISEEIGLAKPDPAIFSLACKQLNSLAKDCLMFGDSLASDHQGAINSGIDFCWVKYRRNYGEQPSQKPHYEVQHLPEMLDELLDPHR